MAKCSTIQKIFKNVLYLVYSYSSWRRDFGKIIDFKQIWIHNVLSLKILNWQNFTEQEILICEGPNS